MNELQVSISKLKVEGSVVFFPEEFLENYKDVRKALINAGGKYKSNMFIFKSDAQPYIDRLLGGESVNIKKEFQFYETPPIVALQMVEMADINPDNDCIMEPSAGAGAILKVIFDKFPGVTVDVCELMPENADILVKMENVNFIGDNFLKISDRYNEHYDVIIANPPFANNQDIDHIHKMYKCLRDEGRLVSIASNHFTFANGRKEIAFRKWLKDVDAFVHDLPDGTFKESGTMVKAVIINISKR